MPTYVYELLDESGEPDESGKTWNVEQNMDEKPYKWIQESLRKIRGYTNKAEKLIWGKNSIGGPIHKVRRVIQASAIHFKGSGFYKTDYK